MVHDFQINQWRFKRVGSQILRIRGTYSLKMFIFPPKFKKILVRTYTNYFPVRKKKENQTPLRTADNTWLIFSHSIDIVFLVIRHENQIFNYIIRTKSI